MKTGKRMKKIDHFADVVSDYAGRPVVFLVAAASVLTWACLGPIFGFSPTWQLVVNTGTTIVTFLMIFLVQSSQNADTEAMQEKLDRLLKDSEDVNSDGLAGKRKERKHHD